jgi:ferredoxin--NADP+ reductase
VVVGGGVGTAVILPQAAALKAEGNYVSAIIGARGKSYVILERELSHICDAVYPCTDDGSYRFRGFVTQRLTQLIHDTQATNPVREVLCAGPVQMMRAVADLTRPLHIETIASRNPIMVDGTGMCGGCRVQVDGRTHFACVDGPEFDAQFEVLISDYSIDEVTHAEEAQLGVTDEEIDAAVRERLGLDPR